MVAFMTSATQLFKQYQTVITPAIAAAGALAGCTFYFIAPSVMPSVAAGLLASLATLMFMFCRHKHWQAAAWFMAFFAAFIFFFGVAKWRIEAIATPFLPPTLEGETLWVTGVVSAVKQEEGRIKFTLSHVSAYGAHAHTPFKKIRISIAASRAENLQLGQGVAAQVSLSAPQGPAFPGDFNYRRWAYFEEIGAVGYVKGSFYLTYLPSPPQTWQEKIHTAIEHWRQNLYIKINKNNSTAEQITAALLTGIRADMPQPVYTAFQETGLAHLLAISGLHLGLVAGMVFFVVRSSISLFPAAALYINSKKTAAFCAIGVSAAYMLLAGSTIPTVRAFILILFFCLAILGDNIRITLRVLMFAAMAVLFMWPESVATASFQMSFIAALALVLWAEKPQHHTHQLFLTRSVGYIKGVVLVSLIASIVTIPIAAYHFNMVSLTGIVANLAAIPLLAFFILPLGFLTLTTMPFGSIHHAPLWLTNIFSNILQHCVFWFQSWPVSGLYISYQLWLAISFISLVSLGFYSFGKKLLAGTFFCAALVSLPFVLHTQLPQPLVWLDNGNAVYAQTLQHIVYAELSPSSSTTRINENFMRRYGLTPKNITPALCDSVGCSIVQQTHHHHQKVLILKKYASLTAEDCSINDVILVQANQLSEEEKTAVRWCMYKVVTIQQPYGALGWQNNHATIVSYLKNPATPWQTTY